MMWGAFEFSESTQCFAIYLSHHRVRVCPPSLDLVSEISELRRPTPRHATRRPALHIRNDKQAVNAAKPSPSKSKTDKALKPKAKIEKESADNNLTKSKKLIGTPQLKGKKNMKNKKIVSEGISQSHDEKKLISIKAKEKEGASEEKNMTAETDRQAVNAAKPSSSKSRTGKALKPKAKIGKESTDNNLTKSEKLIGIPQLKRKKKNKKNKIIVSEGISGRWDENKLISIKAKEKGGASEEKNANGQQTVKPQEKREKPKIQKKNEDIRLSDSKRRNNQMHNQRRADAEKNVHREKKKEKLAGLIFMCNAKTKPDCFRYRVMGVPLGKKDLVLGIKPGTKLFLYDFDLRLLYGVYEASSSGGLKLEPTAFNGAFPVQVRFTVHQDCYPLPENVFKKAIKENYNERNKFDTDLTVKQVKKLEELFQPADFVPKAPALSHQPVVVVESREPHERDHTIYEEIGRRSILPLEDNLQLSTRGVSSRGREEFREDNFLSEKEYRTYGLLRRERQSERLPPVHAASVVEPYVRTYATEDGLRHQPAAYRDIEAISRQDGLSMNEREYKTYGIGGARIELPPVTSATVSNQYYPLYGSSLALDSYQAPTMRDELTSGSYYSGVTQSRELYPPIKTDALTTRGESHLTGSSHLLGRRASYLTEYDSLRRRENENVARIHTAASSRPLFEYNPTRNYQEPLRSDPSQAPVSSRYSFAGPSTLYR